jgi:hypothetical protein
VHEGAEHVVVWLALELLLVVTPVIALGRDRPTPSLRRPPSPVALAVAIAQVMGPEVAEVER